MDASIFLVAGFVVFALVASAAYYFFRYYFQASGVKKAPPRSLLTALQKTRHAWASAQDAENLEAALYGSDLGSELIEHLMQQVRQQARPPYSFKSLQPVLVGELQKLFQKHPTSDLHLLGQGAAAGGPCVLMLVGVNGAGKTTSLGRLAHLLKPKKTMLVAGDTFRAAADLQLQVWAERSGAVFFSLPPKGNKIVDPSAVVFEALKQAQHQQLDFVLVDTAGRLHTQKNLMHELQKVKRTMSKLIAGAPHEVLLVVDASQGQNVIQQGRQFHEALGLTGVVLTKLDGTSRGGCAMALWHELGVPLRAVGVGEGLGDLHSFRADEFVKALLAI